MEQDGLPALQLVGAAKQVLHREALEHHSRGRLERDRIRQLYQRLRRHHANLRVRAGGTVAIRDPVADFQVRDIFAHGGHHAGALQPDACRQRLRVKAGSKVDVDVVQADRMMTNLDFAGTGCADFDVDVLHHFGAAGLFDADRFGH
jgi:hypothetical protein